MPLYISTTYRILVNTRKYKNNKNYRGNAFKKAHNYILRSKINVVWKKLSRK